MEPHAKYDFRPEGVNGTMLALIGLWIKDASSGRVNNSGITAELIAMHAISGAVLNDWEDCRLLRAIFLIERSSNEGASAR